MAKQQHDYSVILNNLASLFLELESLLASIARLSNYFLKKESEYGLEFVYGGPTGRIESVKLAADWPDDSQPDEVAIANCDFVCNEETGQTYRSLSLELREHFRHLCEIETDLFSDWLADLHDVWAELWGAVTVLPPKVVELLSDVRGRHWRPCVRKHVLIPVRYWPRLPSREWRRDGITRLRRTPVPKSVETLLEYTAETDPTDHWLRICRRMDSFVIDIEAIAPELNVKIEVDYDPVNLERDKWLYEQWEHERRVWSDILEEFKRMRPERKWQALSSVNGVRSAAKRYAIYHRLPFRHGTRGRRKQKRHQR